MHMQHVKGRDKETGKLFVLEVNAQCGLSEDEDYTSIGAILRINNKTFAELIVDIMNDAIMRHQKKKVLQVVSVFNDETI